MTKPRVLLVGGASLLFLGALLGVRDALFPPSNPVAEPELVSSDTAKTLTDKINDAISLIDPGKGYIPITPGSRRPPPVQIKQGVLGISKEGVGTAIEAETTTTGGSNEFNSYFCTTSEETGTSLGLHAGSSVDFIIGSVSSKGDFSMSMNQSTHNLVFLVKSEVILGTESIVGEAKLRPGTAAPTEDEESVRQFFEAFGDSYVSSITKGAGYYAAYNCKTTSRAEQMSARAELGASALIKGITVGGEVSSAFSDFQKSSGTECDFTQKILGAPFLPTPPETEAMEFARNFPARVKDQLSAPVVLSMTYSGYENVNALGGNPFIDKMAINRAKFIGPYRGLSVATPWVSNLATLNKVRSGIDVITRAYDYFGANLSKVDPDLVTKRTRNYAQMGGLILEVNRYMDGSPFGDFNVEPNSSMAQEGLPMVEFATARSQLFGEARGDPFDDGAQLSGQSLLKTVEQRWQLAKVQIEAEPTGDARWVTRIDTEYERGNGETKALARGRGHMQKRQSFFDTEPWPAVSGWLVLYQGDNRPKMPITNVEIRSGTQVDWLKFTAKNGLSVEAKSNDPKGTYDVVVPPNDDYIVHSFWGYADKDWINGFGVTWIKFVPCKWLKPQ